jgi:hypothetical protein
MARCWTTAVVATFAEVSALTGWIAAVTVAALGVGLETGLWTEKSAFIMRGADVDGWVTFLVSTFTMLAGAFWAAVLQSTGALSIEVYRARPAVAIIRPFLAVLRSCLVLFFFSAVPCIV